MPLSSHPHGGHGHPGEVGRAWAVEPKKPLSRAAPGACPSVRAGWRVVTGVKRRVSQGRLGCHRDSPNPRSSHGRGTVGFTAGLCTASPLLQGSATGAASGGHREAWAGGRRAGAALAVTGRAGRAHSRREGPPEMAEPASQHHATESSSPSYPGGMDSCPGVFSSGHGWTWRTIIASPHSTRVPSTVLNRVL